MLKATCQHLRHRRKSYKISRNTEKMFCRLWGTRKRWRNKTKRSFRVRRKTENVVYPVLHWYALFTKKTHTSTPFLLNRAYTYTPFLKECTLIRLLLKERTLIRLLLKRAYTYTPSLLKRAYKYALYALYALVRSAAKFLQNASTVAPYSSEHCAKIRNFSPIEWPWS